MLSEGTHSLLLSTFTQQDLLLKKNNPEVRFYPKVSEAIKTGDIKTMGVMPDHRQVSAPCSGLLELDFRIAACITQQNCC